MGWDEVKRARRQLSREQGTVIKDWGGRIPIALIYPNSYYVGMSNLGFQTIYRLLNQHPRIVCERAFGAGEARKPALSLESGRPLADFAVLAFSLTYELDYLNAVQLLKASGIPLYAADRDERHPLVIAGGPCITANPLPLSPFFDGLGIGEAEPLLPDLLPILAEGIGGRRDELRQRLSLVPGVYVPQDYAGTPVVRRWAEDLDDFATTSTVLTPDTELGDLYLIEVERGCNWGCRFCLVWQAFSPMRFRSVERLTEQARVGLGYRRRLGLVGPAVCDHPQIEELTARLRQMGAELSISSLRIKPLPSAVLGELAQGGARTIALAPEAGSPRLRRLIKKDFSEDDILEAIDKVARHRIRQLKLYFIIGLPSETEEDIRAIIDLALKGKDVLDRQQAGARLTLNVAPFVPKAGTPFQWLPMADLPTLKHRIALLKNSLPPKGIKVKAESPAWSQVQAVLARGDTRAAEALANIEEISLAGWHKAADKCHLDIDYYAHQRWDTEEKLPWSVLESGSAPGRLKGELERALKAT